MPKEWEWKTFADAGAFDSWSDKVNFELMEIRGRIESIEAQLKDLGALEKKETAEKGTETDEETPEGREETGDKYAPHDIYDVLVLTARLRRALYGYTMLLSRMGLSRDHKKLVREIEYTISLVMRLVQTVQLLMAANAALSAGSPMGLLFLAIAGGTFAASVAYGSKLSYGGA